MKLTQHAIITGGSSGIGLALAKKLAAAGYNVTILARDAVRLETARLEIESARRGTDQRVLAVSVDVVDAQAVQSAVDTAVNAFGAPALVVASAGIVIPHIFEELAISAFKQTMDVNYLGSVYLVRAALPSMQQAGQGHIALLSSGAGLLGVYGLSAYTPTKFALRGLAEVLRAELRPEGINVSVVYPPDTDTPMLREEIRIRPEITSRIAAKAKAMTADEVADAILKGIAKKKFSITQGFELGALAYFAGVIAPLVNRFQLDPLIARLHKRGKQA
ncbi:SDR family NAD(P)-dependent oxidoreductase [Paraburkholderia silviterrae]|uniref:3-dehydrosphinganine reductase n=1 Tax=Paraburkholderia silviterrae TaxID=2528715 RepID=A0A4R5M936_9BURK|nr:SDR family NAD(P)-dependent oxidoreductase [Paraburkholderia silviterrae]